VTVEHAHAGHAQAQAQHGDMPFMSMVDVTKDLPRSRDGLPMEWVEVPFGPMFPGLPGGLLLTLTLDGDAVAKTRVRSVVGGGGVLPTAGLDATSFIAHLGAMDPLAPVAYRLLACRALEAAAGQVPDEEIRRRRIAVLERERIASHLGWLAMLGLQTGFAWLERHATRMQLECLRADLPRILQLRSTIQALTARLVRTPLLRSRLHGSGIVRPSSDLRGPVARAAGMRCDARIDDETYAALAFEMTERQGGDAFDRLHIRLGEMQQSLALIQSVGGFAEPASTVVGSASGAGHASLETPRGEAQLHLVLESGRVVQAQLDTPTTHHMKLLPDLLDQQELGDALTTVCSLDLSPWEVAA